MTTQQENYINSRLEAFYEECRDKRMEYIEKISEEYLEKQELQERETCEGKLFGAALEAHIKHFLKNEEEEFFKYHMQEFEEEIAPELEEYRKELEAECEE